MDAVIATSLGALAAGFVQGLVGFGAILVALSLLALALAMSEAVPLASLMGLLLNAVLALDLRGRVHRADIMAVLITAPLGVAAGVALLTHLPQALLQSALGITLLAFAVQQLLAPKRAAPLPSGRAAPLAGFLSGCMGGSIGAHGPPVIIWYSLQAWPKARFKGTLLAYLAVSGCVVVAGQAVSGMVTTRVLQLTAVALPGLAIGAWVGRTIYKRLGDHDYKRAVCLLLIVLGASLLLRALSTL